jgi:hypothetical protein
MVNEAELKDQVPDEPVDTHLADEEKVSKEDRLEFLNQNSGKVVRFGHIFDKNSDPRLLVSCVSKENTDFLVDIKVVEEFNLNSLSNTLVANINLPRFQILFDYENQEGLLYSGKVPISENYVITFKNEEMIIDARDSLSPDSMTPANTSPLELDPDKMFYHFSKTKVWIPFLSFLKSCKECPPTGIFTENEMECFQMPFDSVSEEN